MVGFGALFAACAIPAFDGGTQLFYDVIYWPLDGASGFTEDVRFTCALLGAVTMGWALTIRGLVQAAHQLGAPAWRSLVAAMLTWYVIDSAISVASGVPVNAVSNTALIAALLAPILASGVLGNRTARA
jgi:hypothetical protein